MSHVRIADCSDVARVSQSLGSLTSTEQHDPNYGDDNLPAPVTMSTSGNFLFEAGVKMRISLVVATAMLAGATLPVSSQQLVGVPKEVTDKMDENVILMNKQAPIEINPLQKLTHVSRNGGTILYSVETAVPQEKWTQEMRERPSRETTKVMCGDKDTRLLLDYGFQLRYLFTDAAGLFVTSFVVSKDKCFS